MGRLAKVGRGARAIFGLATFVCTPTAFAQEASSARTVEIDEYHITGNTLLSDPEMEAAVLAYMGPDKTEADMEAARAALQHAYEAKGYKTVFVELPQQDVSGGSVRLEVTETPVGKVEVAGGRGGAAGRVTAALPSIAEGQVPDLDRFSRELAALNARSSDRQVSPELKPGAAPGTIDVALNVEDKLPFHGGIELNNQFSRDTKPLRVQANLRYDDLWGLGHSLSIFTAFAPQRASDSAVMVAAYGLPLGPGWRFDLTGLISDSNVATVSQTNVLGKGHSVTATLSRELPAPVGLYHRATLSIAYKDFEERVRFGDLNDLIPITYFPVALGYGGSWREGATTLGYELSLAAAFRGVGSDAERFDYKRAYATGAFVYLKGEVTLDEEIGAGALIHLGISGQIASDPLVSNEEFAAGGAGSVRGYLQSEAVADNALASTIELRTPSAAGIFGGVFEDLRFVVFADGAVLWLNRPLLQEQRRFSLGGVGGGLRTRLFGRVRGDLDAGFPLTTIGATRAGDVRIHFRVSTDF